MIFNARDVKPEVCPVYWVPFWQGVMALTCVKKACEAEMTDIRYSDCIDRYEQQVVHDVQAHQQRAVDCGWDGVTPPDIGDLNEIFDALSVEDISVLNFIHSDSGSRSYIVDARQADTRLRLADLSPEEKTYIAHCLYNVLSLNGYNVSAEYKEGDIRRAAEKRLREQRKEDKRESKLFKRNVQVEEFAETNGPSPNVVVRGYGKSYRYGRSWK